MKAGGSRLIAAFVLICLVGGAIGLVARLPRYRHVEGTCDGFRVQAMWKKRPGQASEFEYLVAFPEGDMHGGGATEWPWNATDSKGVRCHPYGVYVQDQQAVPPNGYGIWVYLPLVPGGSVRFVKIPSEYRLNPGIGDFSAVENSDLWRKFIRPVLVQESLNWRDEYERKNNLVLRNSRFPRRPEIDWNDLDALFPKSHP